jgi:hypothetical protein
LSEYILIEVSWLNDNEPSAQRSIWSHVGNDRYHAAYVRYAASALRGISPGSALDYLEPMRPVVDRAVLQLIDSVTFTGADFWIQHDGVCRMIPDQTQRCAAPRRPTTLSRMSWARQVRKLLWCHYGISPTTVVLARASNHRRTGRPKVPRRPDGQDGRGEAAHR